MTHPTKEQALAALEEMRTYVCPLKYNTLRTYIEGEKDSLGADVARKDCCRDWEEDFAHENGMYYNKCVKCRWLFLGHKRRALCKICDAPASAHVPGIEKVREALVNINQMARSEGQPRPLIEREAISAIAILDKQGAPSESQRVKDLLEANNRYLQRARDAEQKLADLRAKVEGLHQVINNRDEWSQFDEALRYTHNEALDKVIALIDGE